MVEVPERNVKAPDIQVRLTEGPIESPHLFPPADIPVAGAVLLFRGVVRPHEVTVDRSSDDGELLSPEASIDGLEYQVYEPMTTRELVRLAEQQGRKHGVLAVDVEHSHGLVAGGECSFVLQVAGKHRGEAIALVDEFIIEMKRQVPIWKVPRWT